MRNCVIFCLLCLLGCSPSKQGSGGPANADPYQSYVKDIEAVYAKDKRTVVFNINTKGNVLTGETSSAEAKAALLQQLQRSGIQYIDSIGLLPSAELKGRTTALVNVSVANLRVQPEHKAELATQATLGTPLLVLKKQRGWYLVQTPDKYIAWVEGGAIHVTDSANAVWQHGRKLIFTDAYGFAYSSENITETVSDLVYGDILVETGTANELLNVLLPDGRRAVVSQKQCTDYTQWRQTRDPNVANLIAAAKKLIGIPYLWGGTSFKGVDCSGFTKTVYFMNGLVLPRDASQQAELGVEIDTSNNWQNLLPGDLLFFGSRANGNRQERVVHVGIWLGNKEFIHSSGRVQVASLDPSAPNYDAAEQRRFIKVKRISPEASLFDLRNTSVY